MKAISIILALALFVSGASIAIGANYSTANARAAGLGTPGSAGVSAGIAASANGNAASIAGATSDVSMSNSGMIGTGGRADSASLSYSSPIITVGVSHSVAASYTIAASSNSKPNTGTNSVNAATQAGEIGTSAGAQTGITGSGTQIIMNSQHAVTTGK
jgi:hypothetical protein